MNIYCTFAIKLLILIKIISCDDATNQLRRLKEWKHTETPSWTRNLQSKVTKTLHAAKVLRKERKRLSLYIYTSSPAKNGDRRLFGDDHSCFGAVLDFAETLQSICWHKETDRSQKVFSFELFALSIYLFHFSDNKWTIRQKKIDLSRCTR